MKSGNLNFLEPSGPLQACNGTDLPYSQHSQETDIHAPGGIRTHNPSEQMQKYALDRDAIGISNYAFTDV